MNKLSFLKYSPGHHTVSLNGKKVGWVLNPKKASWGALRVEGSNIRTVTEKQRTRDVALRALLVDCGLSGEEIEECLM